MDKHGIDTVIIGEGEYEKAVEIYRMALQGKKLPKFVELKPSECPTLNEISEIKHASVNGLVEIGRGCPRGCKFCSVTLRPLRWYPYEKIEKELKVNAEAGINSGVIHAEDILLYGQSGVIPDEEKQIKLNKFAKRYYKNLSWSHASFAAVASKPKLMEELSEIILDEHQSWWGQRWE
ncbi:MAG TPA: radical SAM protein [Thermoplasmatales archaeon]|nr:radical SAM protein [Thermoplasmatales archaeon]